MGSCKLLPLSTFLAFGFPLSTHSPLLCYVPVDTQDQPVVDVGSCKLPSFQMCASPYAQDVPIPGEGTERRGVRDMGGGAGSSLPAGLHGVGLVGRNGWMRVAGGGGLQAVRLALRPGRAYPCWEGWEWGKS